MACLNFSARCSSLVDVFAAIIAKHANLSIQTRIYFYNIPRLRCHTFSTYSVVRWLSFLLISYSAYSDRQSTQHMSSLTDLSSYVGCRSYGCMYKFLPLLAVFDTLNCCRT